jgi:hypothetical protein
MGNICGRTPTVLPASMQERGVARVSVQRQPEVEEPSASSQQQSRTSPTRGPAGHEEMDMQTRRRRRVESAPQHRDKVSQIHRSRARSVAPPSMVSHLEPRTTGLGEIDGWRTYEPSLTVL